MGSLERVREEFAEKIREAAGLRNERLVRALASVRREAFLGPGPWRILCLAELPHAYQLTPDADPRRLYDNVLVAIDARRSLNNGEPAALLGWLDALDLAPGERFLHVGCGVGYYTAIAAAALAGGEVIGVEIDPRLAERARRNLAPWANVAVECRDGSGIPGGPFDAIFVNAGATAPLPGWLDALAPGGRMLVPLTVGLDDTELGAGHMLRVVRGPQRWPARFVSWVGIFHCAGARSPEGEARLRRAFEAGGADRVRSLRRDPHAPGPGCWLHDERVCLSREGADAD